VGAINGMVGGGDGPVVQPKGQSPTQVAAAEAEMQASGADTTLANQFNAATGGMTTAQFQALPQAQQQALLTQAQNGTDAIFYPESTFDKLGGDAALAASLVAGGYALAPVAAGAAAGAGLGTGAVTAAGVPVLTTAGTIGAGALTGAGTGALQSALTGTSLGTDVGLGALGGGLSAAAQPAIGALGDATGIPAPLAGGIVKGAVGAGVGALGADLTGGNVGNGALVGGIGGATAGVVGGLSGSAALGNAAGTIGSTLAGKYLTGSGAPAPATTTTTPAPTAAAAAAPVMPALPATANTSTGPTNIGSYSGYGYAPRTYTPPSGINYATYGQGPEANFFTTSGSAPQQPTITNTGQQPTSNPTSLPAMPQPMSQIQPVGMSPQST
jgi:hypothetical protein